MAKSSHSDDQPGGASSKAPNPTAHKGRKTKSSPLDFFFSANRGIVLALALIYLAWLLWLAYVAWANVAAGNQ